MATKKRSGVTHRVDVGGSVRSRGARGPTVHAPDTKVDAFEELGHVEGVIGLEFKPKLSEAVMRACGLHGGYVPGADPDDADDDAIAVNARRRSLASATDENVSEETDADGNELVIVDNRDSEGAIFVEPPASPEDCVELVDVQNYLAAKYGGYFERTKQRVKGKGKKSKVDRVTMRFTYGEDAAVVSGSGANNREALYALCGKLEETGFAAFAEEDGGEE